MPSLVENQKDWPSRTPMKTDWQGEPLKAETRRLIEHPELFCTARSKQLKYDPGCIWLTAQLINTFVLAFSLRMWLPMPHQVRVGPGPHHSVRAEARSSHDTMPPAIRESTRKQHEEFPSACFG